MARAANQPGTTPPIDELNGMDPLRAPVFRTLGAPAPSLTDFSGELHLYTGACKAAAFQPLFASQSIPFANSPQVFPTVA